ncbi:hypothetical protein BVRB_9g223400 [Beta vulgaris subsp. vulgaris]|nr:hypothetical protein BVRB_9g223400 [Beta vulgaris subsp. vulgaris]
MKVAPHISSFQLVLLHKLGYILLELLADFWKEFASHERA